MTQPEACLVDVYETILTCDFGRHWRELPALAGVPERAWRQELLARSPALTVGQLSTAGSPAASPEPWITQAGGPADLPRAQARVMAGTFAPS